MKRSKKKEMTPVGSDHPTRTPKPVKSGPLKKNNPINKEIASLRERAQRQLDALPQDKEYVPVVDVKKLIEELHIHQVELELQNEELRRAQSELQQTRDKYYQLFDFAPVGYFTIDKNGLITEVNLSGADLLGYTRRFLLRNGFSRLVAPDDQDIFFHHCKKGYENGDCEHEDCAWRAYCLKEGLHGGSFNIEL